MTLRVQKWPATARYGRNLSVIKTGSLILFPRALLDTACRVKAIDTLRITTPGGSSKVLLTTISSDGFILLYDTSELEKERADSEVLSIEPFARYDTKGTRLTCVAFAEDAPPPTAPVNGQKRRLPETDDEASSLSDG